MLQLGTKWMAACHQETRETIVVVTSEIEQIPFWLLDESNVTCEYERDLSRLRWLFKLSCS